MNIEVNSLTWLGMNDCGQFELTTEVCLGENVVDTKIMSLDNILDAEYEYYTMSGVFTDIQDWRELRSLCRQLHAAADRLERRVDATPIRESTSCSW